MKVVSAQQMRQIEATADAAGLSYATMMDNAGRAVAEEVQQRLDVRGSVALVLVGPGNNGGDGLVAARCLADAGADVYVYLSGPRPQPDHNLLLLSSRRASVLNAAEDSGLTRLTVLATRASVVIDALLGTGVARPIAGALRDVLTVVGAALASRGADRPLVVAVDLPSGLNADSGALDPAALPADVTVTCAFAKLGHFLFPGAAAVGELVVCDIGIEASLAADVRVDAPRPGDIARLLPRRPRDAHKGTFGKLLVVAGCANYTGAAHLAAMAAYRLGAGLVTLAVPRSLAPVLAAKTIEATFLPLDEAEPGHIGGGALGQVNAALSGYDALLIGCGLGAHPETRQVAAALTQHAAVQDLKMVIDADALNALALLPAAQRVVPRGATLTPHLGEMARLTGLAVSDIAGERVGVAGRWAQEWQCVVVLKGAFTIVAGPGGSMSINPFANPALATAGTGDVLAGAVAGLLAQGLSPYDAAVAGAYVHASAGERVAARLGSSGLIASDLLPELPLAMRELYPVASIRTISQAGQE